MNRKIVIANLWLATFIQVAAISSYSPFVPLMKEDLDFSFAEFGLIAAIFFVPYTLMQIVSGRASDKGKSRLMLLVGVPVLLVLSMLFGTVQNLLEAILLRILAGIFAAIIFVPALRVMIKLEPNGLNTAIALLGTSIAAGGLYVSLAGPELGLLLGWRLGIVILMAPGFVIWALNAKFIPVTSRSVRSKEDVIPVWALKKKETWILGYQQFVRIGVWFTLTIWLPTFFTSVLGYNLVLGGAALTIFSVSAIFASIAGGRLANYFGSSSKVILISFMALCAAMAIIAFAAEGALGWGLVAAFGIFDFMPFGPMFAILPKLYNEDSIGFVTGFETMIANLGAVVVPFTFGYLTDATGAFTLAWLVISLMCLLSFVLAVPAIRFEKNGLIVH
ncbi:MAG: MFS transporter [Nitrososphaerales archaeon]